MNTTPSNLIPYEEELAFLAQKFALLLATSDINEEMQDALITALPHLELEQIVNLVNKLETKFLISATSGLDEELRQELEAVMVEFTERQTSREQELIDKIQRLNTQLDS